MQLVQPGIRMYDTMKNKVIGEAEVVERFGVPPSKVVEVQALIGDSSDNVPGVPGIGVKTAALLIGEFGDLETLLARASEIKQDKRRENLIAFADQARLSKTLVILDAHVPLEVTLAETAVRQPDTEALTRSGHMLPAATRRATSAADAVLVAGDAAPALDGLRAELDLAARVTRVLDETGEATAFAPLHDLAADWTVERAFATARKRSGHLTSVGVSDGWTALVERHADGVSEVAVIRAPFRYHAIIERAKRRRGPGDGMNTVSDRVDLVFRKHSARDLAVA